MRDVSDYDVVIVGGGPAGSSTALHLVRREGVRPGRVLVVDKATFPRDKPCAGAVSQLGLDVLAAVGVTVTVPSVTMAGVRVILRRESGETVAPLGVCVRRTEFDAQLLATAQADGVRVEEGDAVAAIERSNGGFVVTTASGARIKTRFIAAADGAGSTTRKLLSLREPARKGHLYVLDTELLAEDSAVKRGIVDFDLTVLDDGLEGYYWDFPTVLHGRSHVSRGIYHANLTRPDAPSGESVKSVLGRALARRGIDIAKVKLRPFSTRPFVPDGQGWLPGVVLVGEAWGIDQTTGEGIAQALEMGRIAARHLATAFVTGDSTFDDYERAVRSSTAGRHMLQSAWFVRHVYGSVGSPARRLLLRSGYARTAAVRWYRGDRLAMSSKVRLALGLVASIPRVRSRFVVGGHLRPDAR